MGNSANRPKIPWWQPGMLLFLKLSSWIAAPVVLAMIVGKYLDRRFQSEPWLFLISVGIAFTISTVMIVVIGKREINKVEKETRYKKQ